MRSTRPGDAHGHGARDMMVDLTATGNVGEVLGIVQRALAESRSPFHAAVSAAADFVATAAAVDLRVFEDAARALEKAVPCASKKVQDLLTTCDQGALVHRINLVFRLMLEWRVRFVLTLPQAYHDDVLARWCLVPGIFERLRVPIAFALGDSSASVVEVCAGKVTIESSVAPFLLGADKATAWEGLGFDPAHISAVSELSVPNGVDVASWSLPLHSPEHFVDMREQGGTVPDTDEERGRPLYIPSFEASCRHLHLSPVRLRDAWQLHGTSNSYHGDPVAFLLAWSRVYFERHNQPSVQNLLQFGFLWDFAPRLHEWLVETRAALREHLSTADLVERWLRARAGELPGCYRRQLGSFGAVVNMQRGARQHASQLGIDCVPGVVFVRAPACTPEGDPRSAAAATLSKVMAEEPDARWLFHGTSLLSCERIVTERFEDGVSFSSANCDFGRGFYVTDDAAYACGFKAGPDLAYPESIQVVLAYRLADKDFCQDDRPKFAKFETIHFCDDDDWVEVVRRSKRDKKPLHRDHKRFACACGHVSSDGFRDLRRTDIFQWCCRKSDVLQFMCDKLAYVFLFF